MTKHGHVIYQTVCCEICRTICYNDPWIPNLGEFIMQSVILQFFYIFNSNSLKMLLIVMKPMEY